MRSADAEPLRMTNVITKQGLSGPAAPETPGPQGAKYDVRRDPGAYSIGLRVIYLISVAPDWIRW